MKKDLGFTEVILEASPERMSNTFALTFFGWLDQEDGNRAERVSDAVMLLQDMGLTDPIDLTQAQQEQMLIDLGLAMRETESNLVIWATTPNSHESAAKLQAFYADIIAFADRAEAEGEERHAEALRRIKMMHVFYGADIGAAECPWMVPPRLRKRILGEITDARRNTFLDKISRWIRGSDNISTTERNNRLKLAKAEAAKLGVPKIGLIAPEDHRKVLRNLGIYDENKDATMGARDFDRTTVPNGDGRQTPAYRVTCAGCGVEGILKATGHTGTLPRDVIVKKFRQQGWTIGRSSDRCPTCSKATVVPLKPKEIEMTKNETPLALVRADAPRVMTPADRRKVFRAVDDAWDERHARYDGGNTDKTIATTLNVPVAWVRDIRVEAFGESQRNADFDKALGDLKNIRADFARMTAAATDLAIKAEKMEAECRAILSRLGELKDAE
jgi:hypothetical protein